MGEYDEYLVKSKEKRTSLKIKPIKNKKNFCICILKTVKYREGTRFQ